MSKYYENNFEHNLPSEIFKKFIGCVDSEYGYSVALKLTEFKLSLIHILWPDPDVPGIVAETAGRSTYPQ